MQSPETTASTAEEVPFELSKVTCDPALPPGGPQTFSGIPKFNSKDFESDSFAEKAQDERCYTRDQAIILTCVDELLISDYTIAVGEIVQPKNVLCSSKVSKNRVCIHLSSKKLVEEFTSEHASVEIKGKKVFIRPLVSPNKRIIFSNVSPAIPNRYLAKILDKLSVNTSSDVTRMKVSISDPGYAHVESHRRQVYVKADDVRKIPPMIQYTHDGIEYYIFAGPEVMRCYKCKKEGHKASNCTVSDQGSANAVDTQLTNEDFPETIPGIKNADTQLTDDEFPEVETDSKQSETPAPEIVENTTFKRPHSPSNSSSISANTFAKPEANKKKGSRSVKQSKKKTKIDATVEEKMGKIDEALCPCRKVFEDTAKTPCCFDDFVNFYKSTYGQNNLFSEVQKISKDKQQVIDLITEIYPLITVPSVKTKLTKIKNKLSLANFDQNALLSQSDCDVSEVSDSEL